MRTIRKLTCPDKLTQWRQANQSDINYGYDLLPQELSLIVLDYLVSEQRGLCAYTGISITVKSAHIEHVFPQKHCSIDEQTKYENLAACTPAPNQKSKLPYGAQKKGNWPSSDERMQFVSPHTEGCDRRFIFSPRGHVMAADGDRPAAETIKKLGLDCKSLRERRLRAINAAVGAGRRTRLTPNAKGLRNRLARLQEADQGEGKLEEFEFVLRQVIPKRLNQVEAIRKSKRGKKR